MSEWEKVKHTLCTGVASVAESAQNLESFTRPVLGKFSQWSLGVGLV